MWSCDKCEFSDVDYGIDNGPSGCVFEVTLNGFAEDQVAGVDRNVFVIIFGGVVRQTMPTRGWQFWYKSIRWPCWALDWRSFWRAVTSLVFSSMSRRIEVSFVWLFLIFECTTECTRGLGLPIEAFLVLGCGLVGAGFGVRLTSFQRGFHLPHGLLEGGVPLVGLFWTPPPSRPAWHPVHSFSVPTPSPSRSPPP